MARGIVRAEPQGVRTRNVNAKARGVKPLPFHLQTHAQRAKPLPRHPECARQLSKMGTVLYWATDKGWPLHRIVEHINEGEAGTYKVRDGSGRVWATTSDGMLGIAVCRYASRITQHEWQLTEL